jgi:hypothetical protein
MLHVKERNDIRKLKKLHDVDLLVVDFGVSWLQKSSTVVVLVVSEQLLWP